MTRYASMSRRAAITGAALAALTLAGCGGKGASSAAEGDMALGAPEGAKVTLTEYASVTCPHCADWNAEVWPQIKAKYVDTGKVRYVFREYLTAMPDVGAAGFLLARCAGEDKYFTVVDQIFRSQAEWQAGTPPRESLLRISDQAGLSREQFQTCVSDKKAIASLEARLKQAQDAGVNGTPTFLVNGVKTADYSAETIMADLDKALAAQ